MLLWLLRVAYTVLLIGMAVISISILVELDKTDTMRVILVPLTIVGVGSLVMLTDIREKQKQITTISAVYFGLLLGLLLGYLFSMALVPILESAFPDHPKMVLLGRALLTIVCCYI